MECERQGLRSDAALHGPGRTPLQYLQKMKPRLDFHSPDFQSACSNLQHHTRPDYVDLCSGLGARNSRAPQLVGLRMIRGGGLVERLSCVDIEIQEISVCVHAMRLFPKFHSNIAGPAVLPFPPRETTWKHSNRSSNRRFRIYPV